MSRQSLGLACQVDTQPVTYFLANSGTTSAVDLNIILSWTGHEILLVGLAAATLPGSGITAAEAQLFHCCSFSPGALTRGALLKRKRRC